MRKKILSGSLAAVAIGATSLGTLLASAAVVTPVPACVLPSPLTLSATRDRDLRKLAGFQSSYGYVGKSLSFFTMIPADLESDLGEAEGVAAKLKAFAAAGVRPVVWSEPPDDLALIDIARGTKKIYWEEYFNRIKSMGVTDAQMGLWVPYPEINAPLWNRQGFAPGDFAKLMNSFSIAYKKVFPGAEAGILLNSYSYVPSDVDWEFGKAESYLPYVKGITRGNVDVVGIQAFPWWPRKNDPDKAPLDTVSKFLFMKWAVESANVLGTKSIMVHSGVPHTMHEGSATEVTIPDTTRARVMREIGNVLVTYEKLGYDMSLSLFLEDKSDVGEGVDWSFDSAASSIMKRISRTTYCNGIPLVLF